MFYQMKYSKYLRHCRDFLKFLSIPMFIFFSQQSTTVSPYERINTQMCSPKGSIPNQQDFVGL